MILPDMLIVGDEYFNNSIKQLNNSLSELGINI